jgi:methyltransferase (TIGR00027 family)
LENDRPSSTATLIAAATVYLAADPRLACLVPEGAAEVCARCLPPARRSAVRALSHPALRWAARLAERATVPGLLEHFMLRKRWIEAAVRAALASGCEQVAIIGAGFDTLAARLAPEFPRARFIEVDHPATQAAKRRAVSHVNLEFVAADLARRRLPDALAGSSYRANASSVFVIEGLLMYLSDAEVAALFAALGELQRARGDVVFTVMEGADFHNATALVRRLLARWSEPFKSALRRGDVPAFLAPFGLELRKLATPAIGEMLVHATRR